ncbi:serine/threonine protein kinase/tetratricopeptide (TPR) repeat protein [Povalibacter uvarum]|uniref:Serine/threonine protein kinase/tetratricopeptide (TPR) repeat protein n=1 Tax=Povalibacter uvarum TaxID=732238 RepID=A0A841HMS6_9GAMM|nr:serine/threonine-protein kinase [Povalibacter uvarum]MBB6093649.1 serine/threonine protein kinase/tetratricopeptide (TPR) repeat protein [Povalibacter uvarum]
MQKSSVVIEQVLDAAQMLPPAERDSYLGRVCAGDRELSTTVRRLLNSVDEVDLFLRETSESAQFQQFVDEIPGFKVVRLLGEGGGGSVLLAQQLVPIKRDVAIKVVKLGMDTKAVVRRFEAEQQALGLMDHPNIARVFGAGATGDGRPYFVMELVRGIRITDYCNQCRLSVPERLAVFSQVCHAIQHAHHKGIIHRDIKPSNVLVTLHDGMAVAKVIDFGIAKAVHGRLLEETLHTNAEHVVGTPAYMSPEQLIAGISQVDTRADVYSLGVLLHELLVGCTPLDEERLECAGSEVMRQRLLTEEPLTPSKRILAMSYDESERVCQWRQTDVARIVRSLRGDLDWIVMRCLEKERARRYQSASELVQDIDRFILKSPVLARPPSMGYVVSKFVRRHKLAVAASSFSMCAVFAGAALASYHAIRAVEAQGVAQQVVGFLRDDLLSPASPEFEPDRDIKMRTVLDRAAAKVDTRFVDQPLVEALVRKTLGQAYEALGDAGQAARHLERSVALREQLFGPDDASLLETKSLLLDVLGQQSKYTSAAALGLSVLEAQRRIVGPDHPDALQTMVRLGRIYRLTARYAEAEVLHREAYASYRRRLGEDNQQTMEALHALAATQLYRGNYKEAQPLLERVVAFSVSSLGRQHPDTMSAQSNLAVSYSYQGKLPQAEAIQRELLEIHERVLGVDHPETLVTLENLANTYAEQGNPEAASLLQLRVLAASRKVRGAEHPYTLLTMGSLAASYEDMGRFNEAVALRSEAISVERRTLGARHPSTLLSMNNLAFDYRILGRLPEAESLLLQATQTSPEVLGPEHPDTLGFRRSLAAVYQAQGRLSEAAAILSDVGPTTKRVLGINHRDTLDSARELAGVLLLQRKPSEAEALLSASIRETPLTGWRLALARSYLGEALLDLNRFATAEEHLLAGYAGLLDSSKLMPAHRRQEIGMAAARVASLYRRWNKPEAAARWERAMKDHPIVASSSQP